jgi:hypothetical protein
MAKTLLVCGELSNRCGGGNRGIGAHLGNDEVDGCVIMAERRQAASAFSTGYMGFKWVEVQSVESCV